MNLILSIIGLINAVYLTFLHYNTGFGCAIGKGCETVITSAYGSLLGIPIAAFGVSLYLILILSEILLYRNEIEKNKAKTLKLFLTTPAAAMGIILFSIQFVYIGSFCAFCSLNSLILVILFIQSYREYLVDKTIDITLSFSKILLYLVLALLPLTFGLAKIGAGNSLKSNVIGEISGDIITTKQFKESPLHHDWQDIKQKEDQLKRQLFNIILLEMHAKKEKKSIKDYVNEVVIPTIQISDSDIMTFYNNQKDSMPKDKTLSELKPMIKNYLVRQKEFIAVNNHIKTLYPLYNAQLNLIPTTPVNIRKNPYQVFSIGDKNAPIKIVEFSDLQCGHCKDAFVAIKRLIDKFGSDLYFEYRHFPLPHNPFSKKFSKASVCAAKQDRFFDYVEIAFANQRKFSKIKPVELAQRLDLNLEEFSLCMSKQDAQNVVDQDIKEGNRLDIHSTPTFFINGQLFVGIPTEADLQLYY
ncbi:MAG: vitamin K epoxide reductase family protein [Candidatus Margulisiibacteriota bacterium]